MLGSAVTLAALATAAFAVVTFGGSEGQEARVTTIVTTVFEPGTTQTVTTTTEALTPSGDQELGLFVDALEGILVRSGIDRAREAELVGIVSSECTPETAGQAALDMQDVANGRGLTLDALHAVSEPSAAVSEAKDLLRGALEHSIRANEYYVEWMTVLEASGCTSTPEARSAFDAAEDESRRATADKKTFVTAFNPLARSLGHATWTHDRI